MTLPTENLDRPIPEKRKPLTRREFGFLLMQQEGKCGCGCGEKLDFSKPRLVTDEHLCALASLGTNDLENRALWITECSRAKTSGEAPGLAKVRRMNGTKSSQASRRKDRGGSSIQGRGFPKPDGYKHKWPKRKVGQ